MKNKSIQSQPIEAPESSNAFNAFRGAMQVIRENPAQFGVGLSGLADSRFALAGRLYQAAARGTFAQQIQAEVEEMIDEGTIKPAYLETDEAHACFADLLDSIDKMSPDPKRYDAIRTAFLRALGQGQTGKGGIYAQQMLRAIYELSAGEIVVLATIYHMGNGANDRIDSWLNDVANASGILRSEIVEGIEKTLMEKRLILPRVDEPKTYPRHTERISYGSKNRLTTFGQEVCENFTQRQS